MLEHPRSDSPSAPSSSWCGRPMHSVPGLNRPLAEAGLTESQFGVLEALLHLGPLHQRELAEKILRTNGNVTLVVDHLEKRGLVRRERGSADRRYIKVHLTDAGEDAGEGTLPGARGAARRGAECAERARAARTGAALSPPQHGQQLNSRHHEEQDHERHTSRHRHLERSGGDGALLQRYPRAQAGEADSELRRPGHLSPLLR